LASAADRLRLFLLVELTCSLDVFLRFCATSSFTFHALKLYLNLLKQTL
jgi:hypothetical protein